MTLKEMFDSLFTPEIETYSVTKGTTRYSITQKGDMSFLKSNGIVYSQFSKKSVYVHSYHDKFLLLPLLYNKPKVLIIGLGAGTVPYQLSRLYGKRISTEVVELDPQYISLTKRFLPKGSIDFGIIVGKGEEFVEKQRSKYDIIIQDAYENFTVPEPFLHDKFMSDARIALKRDGILAINYAPEALYLPIYIHNLRKHFDHVYRIKHISLGNYILICSKELNKKGIIERLVSRTETDKESRRLLKEYKSMG